MTFKLHQDLFSLSYSHRLLLQKIRNHAPISRAELSVISGMSPASVTNITKDLIHLGVIYPKGRRTGSIGQPSIELGVVADYGFTIGLVPSIGQVAVALMDFSGTPRAITHFDLSAQGFDETIGAAQHIIKKMLDGTDLDPERLLRVGIVLPTMFGPHGDSLRLSESLRFWWDVDLRKRLSEAFERQVVIENDANAAAITEKLLGDGKTADRFAYLYLGEGLGGALMFDGKLYRGANGNAGEFGVLLPRHGIRPTLDDLKEFLKTYKIIVPDQKNCTHWINENRDKLDLWLARVKPSLANLLHSINAVFDPGEIIVGGNMPRPLIAELIENVMVMGTDLVDPSRLVPPYLRISDFTNSDASAIGAAAIGLDYSM